MAINLAPYATDEDEDEDGASSPLYGGGAPASVPVPAAGGAAPASVPLPSAAAAAPATRPATDEDETLRAPEYHAPDRSKLQADEAMLAGHQQPIDRNAPGVKATLGDKLRGGFGAALLGFARNPNAIEAGAGVVNQKYNAAVAKRDQQVNADKTAIAADQGTLQSQQQGYEDQLQGFNAQERAVGYNAKATRDRAQADKYRNTVDVNTIEEDPDHPGQYRGHTPGDPDTWVPAAMPKSKGAGAGEPKTYEAMVLAANLEKDPVKAQAYRKAAKEIQQAEVHKFQATAPRAPAEEKLRLEYNMAWKADPANKGKTMSTADIAKREESLRQRPTTGNGNLKEEEDANKIDTDTQQAYRMEEFGDEAKGVQGYKAKLRQLQTDDSLAPKDRDAAIADLNAQHEQRKQEIGALHGQRMQRIRPQDVNNAPVVQAAPTAPRPVSPAPPAQSIQTRITKSTISVGQTVTIGGKPYKVTGVNPQTGKPTVAPAT